MGRRTDELHVNVPSFFRCPISLEVMKSPVSLCTGVTYDRSTIQRWLEAGNNTCPATMQVLPTTDLIPNRTLQRLIEVWSHPTTQFPNPEDLIRNIDSSVNLLPSLRKISTLAKEPDGVDRLRKIDGCVPALNGVLFREGKDGNLEAIDLVVGVLTLLLFKTDDNKVVRSLASPHVVSVLLSFLLRCKNQSLSSKTNAVRILERLSSVDTELKIQIAGTQGILPELARLLTEEQQKPTTEDQNTAINAVLSCLTSLSYPRRIRSQIVRLGVVRAIGNLLYRPSISESTVEKTLKLLESLSTCTEGREAICEDSGVVVTATVGKIMKVSAAATEHGVVVLWSVCHLFRDRRALEAVAASNGLTKFLLLMQSNCSPAAKQMAGDLLRIFRVNSKSYPASYDTKTIHIMPF